MTAEYITHHYEGGKIRIPEIWRQYTESKAVLEVIENNKVLRHLIENLEIANETLKKSLDSEKEKVKRLNREITKLANHLVAKEELISLLTISNKEGQPFKEHAEQLLREYVTNMRNLRANNHDLKHEIKILKEQLFAMRVKLSKQ